MGRNLIVVDLGFGDSGKGTTVDALTRYTKSAYNIRFSGGAQCGHRVVLPDGNSHTFNSFGSGTFAGAKTILSKHMLVDPVKIRMERNALAEHLFTDPYRRLFIDENALVVTPYHVALNRLRSPKGTTCGLGVGECMSDSLNRGDQVIRIKDLRDVDILNEKMQILRNVLHSLYRAGDPDDGTTDWMIFNSPSELITASYVSIGERLNIISSDQVGEIIAKNDCVFEGSQGVLLDQDYGFHPYTTWSSTTPKNALGLCSDAGVDAKVIGVTRTYMTRHGAGPFPTYSPRFTSEMSDPGNPVNEWQGEMRFGWLDLPLLGYAIKACGRVDALAVTHVDTLDIQPAGPICIDNGIKTPLPTCLQEQEDLGIALESDALKHAVFQSVRSDDVPSFIENELGTPLCMISRGPTYRDKQLTPYFTALDNP